MRLSAKARALAVSASLPVTTTAILSLKPATSSKSYLIKALVFFFSVAWSKIVVLVITPLLACTSVICWPTLSPLSEATSLTVVFARSSAAPLVMVRTLLLSASADTPKTSMFLMALILPPVFSKRSVLPVFALPLLESPP